MKRKSLGQSRYLALGILAPFVCLAMPSDARAQLIGDCLTVQVPAPMVLPDGDRHPAGALRICHSKSHSPVSSLHKTFVNGTQVGYLRSRRGTSEGLAEDQPYVLFQRVEGGELVLLGYAWPDGNKMATYRLADPITRQARLADRGKRNKKSSRSVDASFEVEDVSTVLLSARAN